MNGNGVRIFAITFNIDVQSKTAITIRFTIFVRAGFAVCSCITGVCYFHFTISALLPKSFGNH